MHAYGNTHTYTHTNIYIYTHPYQVEGRGDVRKAAHDSRAQIVDVVLAKSRVFGSKGQNGRHDALERLCMRTDVHMWGMSINVCIHMRVCMSINVYIYVCEYVYIRVDTYVFVCICSTRMV
jgi:hypothetical protein